MFRLIIIVFLSSLLQLTFAQDKRSTRIIKNSDTCNTIQLIGKLNSLSVQNRLMLLEEYGCIKNEIINLRSGVTWLSIPRHIRNINNETTATPDVFNSDNISGSSYSQLQLDYNSITPFYQNQMLSASWWNQTNQWTYGNDMDKITSLKGYKLQVYPQESRTLYLHGATEDPNTTMEIKGMSNTNWPENWVGYWLFEEQSPFDAISQSDLDHLFVIKTQDWYCERDYPYPTGGYSTWYCALSIGVSAPRLNYGDMVILKSSVNIDEFQWQNNYSPSVTEVRGAPQHYQYTEKEDYTAYMIEVDTADPPLEIAAFIGDSCIGATALIPGDTLILVRGYDKDTTGEVTFEEHYATKSTQPAINEYFVKIPGKQAWQKRKINSAERKDHYLISFKTKENLKPVENNESLLMNVFPNPAQNSLTVQYIKKDEGIVSLVLYDITGRKVLEQSTRQPVGFNEVKLDTDILNNGIYLLKLSTGEQTDIKQIVINK